jgi:hypothetical protein
MINKALNFPYVFLKVVLHSLHIVLHKQSERNNGALRRMNLYIYMRIFIPVLARMKICDKTGIHMGIHIAGTTTITFRLIERPPLLLLWSRHHKRSNALHCITSSTDRFDSTRLGLLSLVLRKTETSAPYRIAY